MIQICVIALVGLPSSGKTSFCRTILRSNFDVNILHVCYDELFTFLPQTSEKTFKQERTSVLQLIEHIIDSINCNKLPVEGVSNWKQSSSEVFVILCDDNHYYAGMRYELYKICRKHCLSFGQIYFPLELEAALLRNSTRRLGVLPPNVMKKMSERLEAPSTKNQWEKNSLIIEGAIDSNEFYLFIKKCLQSSLTPTRHELKQPQEKNFNAVHELDLLLRKNIKQILQSEGGDLCGRAKLLNERKKEILRETKQQPGGDLDVDFFLKKLFSE